MVNILAVAGLLLCLGAVWLAFVLVFVFAGVLLVIYNAGRSRLTRHHPGVVERDFSTSLLIPSILAGSITLPLFLWVVFNTSWPSPPLIEDSPRALTSALFGNYLFPLALLGMIMLMGGVGMNFLLEEDEDLTPEAVEDRDEEEEGETS